MHFSLDDLRKAFNAADYDRGLDYARQERVLEISMGEGMVSSAVKGSGRHIYAQEITVEKQGKRLVSSAVKGSGRHIYAQEITVEKQGKRLVVEGDCSCPVGYNCKHVAAVLITLAWLEQEQAHGASAQDAAGTSQALPTVPAAAAAWLHRMETALAAMQQQASMPASDLPAKKGPVFRLMFVLTPTHDGKRTTMSLCKARLRVSGDIAAADPVSDSSRLMLNPPAYLVPADEELIQFYVAMHGNSVYYDPYNEPTGKMGAQLLRMLLQEKKLLWANSMKDASKGILHPLQETPARSAELAWHEQDRQLRLRWQFRPADDAGGRQAEPAKLAAQHGTVKHMAIDYVLPTDPPWYIENLSCGELRLPQGGAALPAQVMLALVAQTPSLARKDAVAMAQQLVLRGLNRLLPMPAEVDVIERERIPVQVILRLGSVAHGANAARQDYALLVFSYDGQEVLIDAGEPAQSLLRAGPRGIEKIVRDAGAERAALQRLQQTGFALPPGGMPGALTLPSPAAWLDFVRDTLPLLAQDGWRIDKQDSYRYDLAEIEDWYAAVEENAGNPWFDLELGIVVNQERISLLPVLVEWIRKAPADFNAAALAQHADADQLLADLPNGTRVALPWGRIKPILATLGELYFTDRAASSMRLSTLDAARLAELAGGIELRWLGGDRLRALGEKLNTFGGVRQVAAPHGLQAVLRDYQHDGLAWMQFLREYDLAGILADDMGLGKTIQTLAHILLEKEAGRLSAPALVVAPTSLMGNWQDEAARFAPDLRVLTLQGRERLAQFDNIDQYDLVLTTYALLPRDEDKLRRHAWHLVILDEAHYIKNARSKAAQTAGLLRARHRLCLTGTPLENHLGELWSQFHFLLPGLLGDEKLFNAEFRGPIEKRGDDTRRALLVRRIKPFLLRRTKDKVASELPPKTEMVRMVELAGAQRDLYETVRLAMDKKVRDEIAKKGVARSQIVILEALLKLRQVCCDPRLVKSVAAKKIAAPSAKLNELLEMLDALLEEGRRILVFSQFTSMLALIEAELTARGISYALLTGDTADRAGAVRAFQQGQVPLFLISLKAGGVGLNLTAADVVIHYDPWWNPAAENQATDRAWRIGQDKPVFVYKLIARGTLEEKIQALQQKKAELAQSMLGDGAAHSLTITAEDLQLIFAPLAG